MQKRVLAINDLSCYGRCALTVTLPVLSAAGVECSIIPTTVLSTHLAYPKPVNISMTDTMPLIYEHINSIGVELNAVAIGYLDNIKQCEIVTQFVKDFKKTNTLVIADPTMADNGKMYGNSNFNDKFVEKIREIVSISDLTVPNITEAAFICGVDYKAPPYDKSYIEKLLHNLIKLGARKAVVTGVIFEDGLIGCAGLDNESEDVFYTFDKMLSGKFIGTGDLFAASIIGALLKGIGFQKSAEISTAFVTYAIEKSITINSQASISINFEQSIPFYMKKLGII